MPTKITQTPTLRDAEVVLHHGLENRTLEETGKIMNLSKSTIKRTKRRAAYNELAIQAGEDLDHDIKELMKKLWDKTEAKYKLKGAEAEEVDAHSIQMRALERLGDVYGIDAPKEVDIAGLIASSSIEELLAEIVETKRRYEMAEGGEQPAVDVDNSETIEGAVL